MILKLAPKAEVLEGWGIEGHFESFESQKWHFQGFSRGIFHHGCYIVSSEYLQHLEQCHRNVAGIPWHRTVRTFHRSKPVSICIQCHSKLEHRCFTILFDRAYFLLAVMVERDESSRLRTDTQLAVLASYRRGPYWQPWSSMWIPPTLFLLTFWHLTFWQGLISKYSDWGIFEKVLTSSPLLFSCLFRSSECWLRAPCKLSLFYCLRGNKKLKLHTKLVFCEELD